MIRLFDSTFLLGTVLVLVALAIAAAALMKIDLPVLGAGTGALLAVALIGIAGCAVGGIAQAPTLGWTSPTMMIGTVLGIVAFVIIAAGVFGWAPVLEPVARLVPSQLTPLSTAQLATFALAGLIAIKWLIATGIAIAAR